MNMHGNFTQLMSLVLDGEATLGEQAQLQAHLRTCAACDGVWEAWKETDRLLSYAPEVAPPSTLLVGFPERLSVYEAARRRSRWVGAGLLATWGVTVLAAFWVLVGLALSSIGRSEVIDAALWPLHQLSDGVFWTVRGIWTLMQSVGWQGFALGLGVCMVLAGAMMMMWLGLLGRAWVPSPRAAEVR